jgi:hypothetical protein
MGVLSQAARLRARCNHPGTRFAGRRGQFWTAGRCDGWAVRWFDGSTVRRFDGSTVRRLDRVGGMGEQFRHGQVSLMQQADVARTMERVQQTCTYCMYSMRMDVIQHVRRTE